MCCYKYVLWCIYVLFYMGVCNIWVGWYMCVIREICKGRGGGMNIKCYMGLNGVID